MCARGDSTRICAFVSQRTVFANRVQPATLVVSDGKIQEILYDTGEDVARCLSEVSCMPIVRRIVRGNGKGELMRVSEVSRHSIQRLRLVGINAWDNRFPRACR